MVSGTFPALACGEPHCNSAGELVGGLYDLGLKLWVGAEFVINILKNSGEEIDFSDDILNFVTFRPRGRPPGCTMDS